jgi:hypothetical protein
MDHLPPQPRRTAMICGAALALVLGTGVVSRVGR